MPRVKAISYCEKCGKPYHRHGGNVKAQFCSVLCSLRSRHTHEFQRRAALAAGQKMIERRRGKGKKHPYVKFYGRHEHRVVMEKALGRRLKFTEVVHHIDGNPKNNKLSNLVLLTRKEHIAVHVRPKSKYAKQIIRLSKRGR